MTHPGIAYIIFPHQLFEDISALPKNTQVYLVEESLFFTEYKFHKQKIAFQRAGMKFYEHFLASNGFEVNYIEAHDGNSDIRKLIKNLSIQNFSRIIYRDTTDNWLEKRIAKTCSECKIEVEKLPSLLFLNTSSDVEKYFSGKKKYFQTDFYKQERIRKKILIDNSGIPSGGKWSFDEENRKKYPKDKTPPLVLFPETNTFYKEAILYTEKYFSSNYGQLNTSVRYPCTYEESRIWLDQFLKNRFSEFGLYEDAIVSNENFLHHSLLSPLINTGLITPAEIIDKTIQFANKNNIPINSMEGFTRQVTGWREFVRGVYEMKGTEERTKNFWRFKRKIPSSFWNATTGILPVDAVIKKILETGYCHHIERLMILGNFMLLCEFHPDEVYRWFMEMFIDSYDWVMVPNVYGMSQFADGGLMSTKPYISGSNYILKMSDFKKGEWQEIWDALFWHFIQKHETFFISNHRLSMLVSSYNKMPDDKKKKHLNSAKSFFTMLDNSNK
ncbi:MAG: cryptochrome/photolyase family protein [Bacteroidetes bacterium]|nr:cryptochrome/photolyase family protein [Bacteroidota bacterium]